MKKLYLILFVMAGLTMNAQPVLNSNEMLPFGTTMQHKYILNLNVIDTTNQGANQVWNFTALTGSGAPDLFSTTVDPANTPHSSSFTNSNYAYVEAPNTAYRYFKLSSTKFERVGSWVTGANIYSDPQIEYVFPFNLGATSFDTWANTSSSFGGNYDLACIGTGTLKLPSGDYTALLVRVHLHEGFIDFFAYFWYDADNGVPLLTRIYGDGIFILDDGYYLSSLSIGIEENVVLDNLKFNNPVRDILQLSYVSKLQKDIRYNVYNSVGQIQSTGVLEGASLYKEIDFSNLGTGLYIVELSGETKNNSYRIKVIKQ